MLVTDKGPGLSSDSLTSTHSALLSGRHLESGKELRARREMLQRDSGWRGRSFIFLCVCQGASVCSAPKSVWARLSVYKCASFAHTCLWHSPFPESLLPPPPHFFPLFPYSCIHKTLIDTAYVWVIKPNADCVIKGNCVKRSRKVGGKKEGVLVFCGCVLWGRCAFTSGDGCAERWGGEVSKSWLCCLKAVPPLR